MKKEFVFLFVMLLFINLVVAQEANPLVNIPSTSASNVKEKTNQFLEQEITIPENLQLFAKFFLGFGQVEKISFSEVIILLALWVYAFLLIISALNGFAFFDNKFLTFLASLAVTGLLGISGALREATIFLYDITFIFRIGTEMEIIKIVLALLGAGIILLVGIKMFSMLKRDSKSMQAMSSGIKTGAAAGVIQNAALAKTGRRL